MKDIILKKIDNILEKSDKALLHLPPCEDGMYFDAKEGVYELEHILSTNQAFITAMAIQAYHETKDSKYVDWCMKFADKYYEKVVNRKYDTSQDLGLLYMLYAVPLYKITGNEMMREIALRAADELTRRFIPNGNYIKAWGRADSHYPSYIDSCNDANPFFNENRGLMLIETIMNTPLLFWALRETNQPFYERIAVAHINTTMKNLIRNDYSTAHGYRFDEVSGEEYCEDNYFGYNSDSYWAKGAAMAIYGLTLRSRYSRYVGDVEYATTAAFGVVLKLLDRFIDSCGGKLPVWDFDCPEKKVDTQAAAIALCAVRQIQKRINTPKISEFADMLSSELASYIDTSASTDGILKGQNGKNEYDIVGDYFFVEAILENKADIWF